MFNSELEVPNSKTKPRSSLRVRLRIHPKSKHQKLYPRRQTQNTKHRTQNILIKNKQGFPIIIGIESVQTINGGAICY
jgi:hypothetical protein